VREAIAIIRAMLAGDSAAMNGQVFSIDGARLGFRPRRHDLPIYMAAAGERALKTCGAIADGLIVSNLTPPRSTERLVQAVRESSARAGRSMPRIVQYVPCVVRPDGDIARAEVRVVLGEMLMSFWPDGDDWPTAKEAIVAESGISRAEFADALARLRRGEDAVDVLDERFVTAFAIAGTAQECLTQAARYRDAGVDELALTIAGARPKVDIAYLGRALP
jgi:5,10-methylenetetrahydromethanopterin reductase